MSKTHNPNSLDESGEDLLPVCPECDKAHITPATRKSDYRWRCKSCAHKFDRPAHRPAKSHSTLTGLTQKLWEMDPDEIPP